ncbi:winged helix DNA-binding protein [Zavarzinia compransoris]|uniref:winged helix DNA-binding protein n=1 Tax=Zavarzinia marina TaxID=2911065 RepID=UPI001F3809ED|nr:winged helix DNA-binding protein [Zavarzinia marina]MCF4167302.1 winged helix DNA-binding protein [Zavarzinia marina]
MSKYNLIYPITRENAALNFLKLFFPYHYTVGMAVEKNLSSGILDRHQTVIMWLIHSRGHEGRVLHRKVIEQLIIEWYELSSPAISKALRKLSQPPLEFLTIEESAESGREKVISLTDKGVQFISEMIANGERFINAIVQHLTDVQIHTGMEFMSRVGEVVELEMDEDERKPAVG